MKARTHARTLVTAVAVLALAALSACDSVKVGSNDPTKTPTPTLTETVSVTPSSSASETATNEPTPSVTPTSSGPVTLPDRLLKAGEMPGFTKAFRWEEGSTGTREPKELFGTCQKFMMTSIGAMRIVVRDFTPAAPSPGSTAGQLVAQFPDEMTARRAYEVLKSWHNQCTDKIKKHKQHKVGALEPVDVGDSADGDWYLLTYGPVPDDADSAYFDAQGITKVGKRISLLELKLVGQDYNYSPGREPMVAAVKAAAAKLG